MRMQPSQPSAPNGLSALSPGNCNANLPWPLAAPLQPTIAPSIYGTYLSTGQALSGALSPMVPFHTPYVSTADSNPLNATTFLAAAAALQQHTLNAASLFAPSAKTSSVNGGTSYATTFADQHVSTCHSTPLAYSLTNGHCTSVPSRPVSASESWCPAKRPNRSVSDLLPESDTSVSGSLCIGPMNGQRDECTTTPATASMNENTTSLTACFSVPSTCSSAPGGISVPHSGVSGLLNPISLYGLPFSNQHPLTPSFVSTPPHLNYSSLYPTQGTPDAANSAAALTFNTWLPQQVLSAQVPVHQTAQPNPSLATAMAAFQPQHPSSDLSTTASSSSLAFQQQQQQQAVLLSLILRAQQSQLAAAHLAAAVQATGTTGFLQATSPSRSSFAGLPSACVLDSSFPYPNTLNGITANPYSATVSSPQNPITNVAYVNDKGHLLETLPICRDFKAGKCHRNADCRYVHLVDEFVEVNQGRVIVCRDAAKGRCTRVPCKYYHVPLLAISANRSLALNSALATAGVPANQSL